MLENSPQFAISDDEFVESVKRKAADNCVISDEKIIESVVSKDIDEIPAKKMRHLISLVSYGLEEGDYEETVESDTCPKQSSFEKTNILNLMGLDGRQEYNVSSDGEDNLSFKIIDGPYTVYSSEHTASDIKAVIEEKKRLINCNESILKDITMSPTEVRGENENSSKSQSAADVNIPPEPPGHCKMVLQEKVERAVRRMRLDISYDPNRSMQDNKAFRNPSIYDKLISYLKIDEKGTNFPKELYDPHQWKQSSYYDELSRAQNREIERLEKLRKDKIKSDATGVSTTCESSSVPSQSTITCSSSGPVLNILSGCDEKPPINNFSLSTGFSEPKKRSKWDNILTTSAVMIQPPANKSLSDSEPIKLSIPAIGGLFRRK